MFEVDIQYPQISKDTQRFCNFTGRNGTFPCVGLNFFVACGMLTVYPLRRGVLRANCKLEIPLHAETFTRFGNIFKVLAGGGQPSEGRDF